MLKTYAKALIFIALVISSQGLSAQGVSSSYSSIGIGTLKSDAQASQIGMAGVGVSTGTPWHSNRLNPALLVDNTFTVFDFGMNYEYSEIKSEDSKQVVSASNLAYLSMVFPIEKSKWALGLSYSPYSIVKYNIMDTAKIEGTDKVFASKINGSGGINKLELDLAYSPVKGLKIGLGAIFYNGTISREEIVYPNPQDVYPKLGDIREPYKARYTLNQVVRHFGFRLGSAYSTELNEKLNLNLGAVYEYAGNLNPTVEETGDRFHFKEGENSPENEEIYKKSAKKDLKVPGKISIGLGLEERGKWSVQSDFSYQDWSDFEDPTKPVDPNTPPSKTTMGKSSRIALGADWTPDYYSVKNYLNRITYRVGTYYEKSPIVYNGDQLDDIGVTAGFSLPVKYSTVNFGFKYGKRGNTSNAALQENYFQITAGISFGDNSWFIKRKYD